MSLVKDIQDEYEEETGERPSRDVAEVIIERRCEAFVGWFEGAGAGHAVCQDPQIARYLAGKWDGEECDKLRAALKVYDGAATFDEAAKALRALDGEP